VNTLAAITYGQNSPILINGRIVKSINQWYNKRPCKSRSRKRYFRLENYFHHASKFIVDLCIKEGIGTIIIGRNKGWKQNHFLGQNKAIMIGSDVTFTEESYTSKASFFDNDPLPEYDGTNHTFSGKRKYRGLYVTKDGFAINADVNGSLNIGRKVIPEFVGIGDRSLAARPVVINPLKPLTV